jgi:hypothetical protein
MLSYPAPAACRFSGHQFIIADQLVQGLFFITSILFTSISSEPCIENLKLTDFVSFCSWWQILRCSHVFHLLWSTWPSQYNANDFASSLVSVGQIWGHACMHFFLLVVGASMFREVGLGPARSSHASCCFGSCRVYVGPCSTNIWKTKTTNLFYKYNNSLVL